MTISLLSIQSYGAKKEVALKYKRQTPISGTVVNRAPMHLPIEVTYDDETRQIDVNCDWEELTAQVYLCDENGNTLAYSPCINRVLDIPANYSGLLLIRIVGDDREGQATVAV